MKLILVEAIFEVVQQKRTLYVDRDGGEAKFLEGVVIGRGKVPSHDAENHLLKGARNAVGLVVARLPRIRQGVTEWRLNDVRQMEYAIRIPLVRTWGNRLRVKQSPHVILEVTPRKNRWVLSTADIIVVKKCYPVGKC